MNKDIFEGKWHQFKGKIKEKWGKLTDEDLTQINGKSEQLSGKLQERYGWGKEKADQEISSWRASCNKDCACGKKDCKCCSMNNKECKCKDGSCSCSSCSKDHKRRKAS